MTSGFIEEVVEPAVDRRAELVDATGRVVGDVPLHDAGLSVHVRSDTQCGDRGKDGSAGTALGVGVVGEGDGVHGVLGRNGAEDWKFPPSARLTNR